MRILLIFFLNLFFIQNAASENQLLSCPPLEIIQNIHFEHAYRLQSGHWLVRKDLFTANGAWQLQAHVFNASDKQMALKLADDELTSLTHVFGPYDVGHHWECDYENNYFSVTAATS